MPTGKLLTIHETLNAGSHVGSGANQSAATGTIYRIDSLKFARFLAEDNCFIAILADTRRTDVRELLGKLAAQVGSATTNARKPGSLRACITFLDVLAQIPKYPKQGVQVLSMERSSRTALRA